MRDYELTVVFSPEIDEEDMGPAVDRVSQFVTQKGGDIIEVNRWGRRKLAYPIKNFREGEYALIKLKLQPSEAEELEVNLSSGEGVLRYLLVRLEE